MTNFFPGGADCVEHQSQQRGLQRVWSNPARFEVWSSGFSRSPPPPERGCLSRSVPSDRAALNFSRFRRSANTVCANFAAVWPGHALRLRQPRSAKGLKARQVIAQAGASRRAEAWVNAIKSFSGLSGRHRVNARRRAGPTRKKQGIFVSFVGFCSKSRNRVAVEVGLVACTLGSSPTRNPGLWAGIPLGFSEGWWPDDPGWCPQTQFTPPRFVLYCLFYEFAQASARGLRDERRS